MAKNAGGKTLSSPQTLKLLEILRSRFEKNTLRHRGIVWTQVQTKLEKNAAALWSLNEMERTGGEPDVVLLGKKPGPILFVDCSPESPAGRRSLCYDRAALNARKEHKPKNSAMDLAQAMGIEILSEEEYRALQEHGEFDRKTSSWVKTPADIRKLGGAIFCDRRYDKVFTYHNGADSYYAARGFRGRITL